MYIANWNNNDYFIVGNQHRLADFAALTIQGALSNFYTSYWNFSDTHKYVIRDGQLIQKYNSKEEYRGKVLITIPDSEDVTLEYLQKHYPELFI